MAAEADLELSIPPSMVDGLKPLQEKVLDAKFEAKQEETRRWQEKYSIGEKLSKAALTTRPKNTSIKPQKAQSNTSDDDEDSKPKPEAQEKKPAKKASASVGDDEDLKDHLAVYDFDLSSEHSAMETETTEGHEKGKKGRTQPSKRGAAKNKFVVEEVLAEKQARERKPAAEKPKKTTIRKRAPAGSNSGAPSPEKKARKMKASPFKEKCSAVASAPTASAEAPPASGSSDQAVAPRRSARLKQST